MREGGSGPLAGRNVMRERRRPPALATEMEPARRVLLLGEGNFSFAASLCGAAGTHVVATCYESEEEVAGRGRAAESIRRLRERGGSAPAGLGGPEVVGQSDGGGGRDGEGSGVAGSQPLAVTALLVRVGARLWSGRPRLNRGPGAAVPREELSRRFVALHHCRHLGRPLLPRGIGIVREAKSNALKSNQTGILLKQVASQQKSLQESKGSPGFLVFLLHVTGSCCSDMLKNGLKDFNCCLSL